MKNSRSIDDLHPTVAAMCRVFIAEALKEGIDILITSTLRDFESQNSLYAQGRTTPGKKVTNAKGGDSFHNYAYAFDFVPLVNGKPTWEDSKLFLKCGLLAEKAGLEWAGRWTKFPEMAHCQFTGGLSLTDLKAGKRIEVKS